MSNARRTKWTQAEITAATAVDEMEAVLTEVTAEAARVVITEMVTADLASKGHAVGTIALVEQTMMSFDDEYWAGLAAEYLAESPS
jgi:hypothetical protein